MWLATQLNRGQQMRKMAMVKSGWHNVAGSAGMLMVRFLVSQVVRSAGRRQSQRSAGRANRSARNPMTPGRVSAAAVLLSRVGDCEASDHIMRLLLSCRASVRCTLHERPLRVCTTKRLREGRSGLAEVHNVLVGAQGGEV